MNPLFISSSRFQIAEVRMDQPRRSIALLWRTTSILLHTLTVVIVATAAWRVIPSASANVDKRRVRALAANAEQRPTLLIVFQEKDCTSFARFVTDWRRLVQHDSIRVIGVPINVKAPDELERISKQFPVQFPLRPELAPQANALLRMLNRNHTPAAVLLDHAGRPLMVVPGTEASINQLEVQFAILSYLRMLRVT